MKYKNEIIATREPDRFPNVISQLSARRIRIGCRNDYHVHRHVGSRDPDELALLRAQLSGNRGVARPTFRKQNRKAQSVNRRLAEDQAIVGRRFLAQPKTFTAARREPREGARI